MQTPEVKSIDLLEPDTAGVGADQPDRQLRLALAMRGGVSLAVWIGGAVSEIDRLRTSKSVYGALLEANGFNDVIVDVISGASAGGLNGAVYTAAQLRNFSVAETRELWVEVGDIERLARATTPGQRAKAADEDERIDAISRTDALRPPSILRGDEFFYATLLTEISQLSSQPSTPLPGLDLLLSATLFNPEIARVVIDDAVIERPAANALFRFTSRDGTLIPIDQLAMAARATSSFPFAFETARIAVGPTSAMQAIDEINFKDVFELPPGARADRVHRVMDGGVLDNIPVAAAIDAVVAAPATQRTERWVCYLHPSPTELEETDPGAAGPRGLQILMQTVRARFNQESLLDDIALLKQVGEAAKQRTQLRDAIFAPVSNPRDLHDQVSESQERLDQLGDLLEATRITQHLHRGSTDGTDPSFVGWEPTRQQRFQQVLRSQIARHQPGPGQGPTLSAVGSAVGLLIAFARTIESQQTSATRGLEQARTVGDIKGALYAERAILTDAIETERNRWATAIESVADTTDPSDYITDALLDHRFATAALWENVVALGQQLSVHAHRTDILKPTHFDKPFSLLAMDGELEQTLLNVVAMSQPVELLGPGPWSAPRFVYINGAAECLLPTGLTSESATGPTARDKLCGNELANFASFLSARWRANDWLWGRLDTASTLVDQLVSDDLLASDAARSTIANAIGVDPEIGNLRDEVKAHIQREIFDEEVTQIAATGDNETEARPWPENNDGSPDLNPSSYTVGNESISSLGIGHRVRVGMRLAHLSIAALRPDGDGLRPRAIRVGASLAKPFLLAMTFLILAPVRAAFALALGAASIQTTFWRANNGATMELGWPAAVAVGCIVVGAVGALILGSPGANEPPDGIRSWARGIAPPLAACGVVGWRDLDIPFGWDTVPVSCVLPARAGRACGEATRS